ncbi:MAG: DinB family protein [Chitinophagaceae bacterium]|nr:DinB family protein [Chitinophagaceae bacterium]
MKKFIATMAFCMAVFVFILPLNIWSQPLNAEDIKAQMVKDWERAKAYTIDYLNTMPADKYSFKANDSIRSFAQQMIHLAQGNIFLMSNATDQQPPAWLMSNPERRSSAHAKDSVMYYVTTSYDFCINGVKNSDIGKWGEKKKLFGRFEETKFALLNKTFEHQSHHRGQTTIYIRMLGVKPPEERLF